MSDEQIIETADKWRQQERADKLKQRGRVWSFVKTCFVWVLGVAGVTCICCVVVVAVEHINTEHEEQESVRETNKLRQADRRRAQELAWVECVNAIGVDLCTLVGERLQ